MDSKDKLLAAVMAHVENLFAQREKARAELREFLEETQQFIDNVRARLAEMNKGQMEKKN